MEGSVGNSLSDPPQYHLLASNGAVDSLPDSPLLAAWGLAALNAGDTFVLVEKWATTTGRGVHFCTLCSRCPSYFLEDQRLANAYKVCHLNIPLGREFRSQVSVAPFLPKRDHTQIWVLILNPTPSLKEAEMQCFGVDSLKSYKTHPSAASRERSYQQKGL